MRSIGRLLLRLTVGGFFFGHGTQKLFGWFGGHGLEPTGQFFESLGMRPGRRNALAAGVAESAGGAGILAGFATPLAAGALTSVMLTAINRVHLKNGPWVSNGGYEYNVVLIAAVLALAETGPGPLSVDGDRFNGSRWATLALLLGALGAVGAHVAAELGAPPEPVAQPEQAAAEPAPEPEPVAAS